MILWTEIWAFIHAWWPSYLYKLRVDPAVWKFQPCHLGSTWNQRDPKMPPPHPILQKDKPQNKHKKTIWVRWVRKEYGDSKDQHYHGWRSYQILDREGHPMVSTGSPAGVPSEIAGSSLRSVNISCDFQLERRRWDVMKTTNKRLKLN